MSFQDTPSFRKRIVLKVGSVLAGAIIVLGISATPASAATWDRCPHNNYCLFEHANGGGSIYRVFKPTGGIVNLPGWFNDRASSVWNRSGRTMDLHIDMNCHQLGHRSGPYGNPTNLLRGANDRASSFCGLV